LKVLLSGCAGFIGSHTCESLLDQGHEVIGIDNFSKFYAKDLKVRNMSLFYEHPNFTFYEIDIRNRDLLFSTLTESVDVVIHLAAKAGVRPSMDKMEEYIQVNLEGTRNLLDWMLSKACKKLFFASSSSVYGNNINQSPSKEGENDNAPISPYAYTKRSAELLINTYHDMYQLDTIMARFFSVYGPRQRPDLAIYKFADAIKNDRPLDMYGDGSTARDYTFISDIIDGINNGVDYLLRNENVSTIINLGNGNPVRLSELIQTLQELIGKQNDINQLEEQKGDVNFTCANIQLASSLLGYEPQVPLKVGLKHFIDWYFNTKEFKA